MTISEQEIDTLRKLEESLLVMETRYDDEYIDRVFAPDFFEFGCSGRTYEREEMLGGTPQEIKARLRLPIREIVDQTVECSSVDTEENPYL